MTEIVRSVTYKAESQSLTVTAEDVRNVLGAPTATDGEIRLFLELCKARGLNPFLKEAYIVKYGDSPATIITGKDVFVKRAARNPRFEGFKAGIVIQKHDGTLEKREGAMVLTNETLVGGWAEVYVQGYKAPVTAEVGFNEYAGRKKDGSLNQQWRSKPATMIRKVPLVQALREAFPEDFQGMYDEAEMDVEPIEAEVIEVSNVTRPQPQTYRANPASRDDSRPAYLDGLREVVREAKSVGLDPKELTAELEDIAQCEVQAMSDEMIAEAIDYVKAKIADGGNLAGEDISF